MGNLSATRRLELVKRVNRIEMGSIVSEVVPIELSLDFDLGFLRARCAEANIDRRFSIFPTLGFIHHIAKDCPIVTSGSGDDKKMPESMQVSNTMVVLKDHYRTDCINDSAQADPC